ncbi:MAG: hydantoinase/carbamoylase family amidase [Granulosicoccus sp.]
MPSINSLSPGLDTARRLFEQLATQTADSPGVTRASFGEGEALAHAMVITEAKRIGLEHRKDAIGNLYITLPGIDRKAPRLMIGSHLDSVPHGGNYDGAAGVLAGLALLEELSENPAPAFDITVMAIRAEEMIWFPEHYIGSRAAFGLLPTDTATRVQRADTRRTLADHMRDNGLDPNYISTAQSTLDAEDIRCFIELHIEQGPVLIENDKPVGIVTKIRGNKRYRYCHIQGQTTHAGGVPRKSRYDALLAGVNLVSELETQWIEMENTGHDLVLTIGQFCTDGKQHGITKVPGRIDFTLDFRSSCQNTLLSFDQFLQDRSAHIAKQRQVSIELGRSTAASAAVMDETLIAELADSAYLCGVPTMLLPSGGGHDSAVFAGQNIPTALLFIRNENGSHNPEESMEFEDFAAAFKVLLNWTSSAICKG